MTATFISSPRYSFVFQTLTRCCASEVGVCDAMVLWGLCPSARRAPRRAGHDILPCRQYCLLPAASVCVPHCRAASCRRMPDLAPDQINLIFSHLCDAIFGLRGLEVGQVTTEHGPTGALHRYRFSTGELPAIRQVGNGLTVRKCSAL
jgi:hypothetical protein